MSSRRALTWTWWKVACLGTVLFAAGKAAEVLMTGGSLSPAFPEDALALLLLASVWTLAARQFWTKRTGRVRRTGENGEAGHR